MIYAIGDLVLYPNGDDLYYCITGIVHTKRCTLYTLEDTGGIPLPMDISAAHFKPFPQLPVVENKCPPTKPHDWEIWEEDETTWRFCKKCNLLQWKMDGPPWHSAVGSNPERVLDLCNVIDGIKRRKK